MKESDFPRTVKVMDHLYTYEDFHAGDEKFTTTNLFLVTDEGVLVVDGQGSAAATKGLVQAIAKVTNKPIRYIVIGSDHGDHTAGNASFPADVTYIIHPTSKAILDREIFLNRVFPAKRSAYPSEWLQALDRAEAMRADIYIAGHGFTETGPVSREEIVAYHKALQAVIAEATRLHDAGVPVDKAIEQAHFGEYSSWTLSKSQAPIAIRRVYDELDGKLK
jgi:hypothetical protein